MSQLILKNAAVVTLDKALGNLSQTDILIAEGKIVQIAPDLQSPGAEIVDCREMLLFPGFVNAHQHTWETPLRGIAGDLSLAEYLPRLHAELGPRYTPDELYLATLLGALNQIACGTTTLVDWCHNNPTPDHSNRAIEALLESGIRALFLHGSPKPKPQKGQPDFSEIPHSRSEMERLKRTYFNKESLVTLGMAILGPHYSTFEVTLADFGLARELGCVCSMHVGGGVAKALDGWQRLPAELLSAKINIAHGNNLTETELQRLVEHAVSFTSLPEVETSMGHGWPITTRLTALGKRPSLGVDVESAISGDMFTVMRMALAIHRGLEQMQARTETGKALVKLKTTAKDVLEWATLGGAEMAALQTQIGSLTPGKQADIVFLRTHDLNLWPSQDPFQTLVFQANASNVDSVMIAGRFVKRHGKLLYTNLLQKQAELLQVRERLLRST